MSEKNQIKNKIVETYAEDMARAIGENKDGIIKKIIHEQEEHELQKKNLSSDSGRNKTFMLIGMILIVLAMTALVLLAIFKKQIFTTPVVEKFPPIIFTDQVKSLEIAGFNKDKIVQTILNEINTTKIKESGVESIYLTENGVINSFSKFSSLIKSNLPVDFLNFTSENFLMGFWNGKNQAVNVSGRDLFILLRVRSFTDVLPYLHTWENKMFLDLGTFFNVNITSENNYLLTKDFEDEIVNNKNARVLYDKENKIVLMYVFANDNSVIISNSIGAVTEINIRLDSSKVKK